MNFLTFCDNSKISISDELFRILGFAYKKVMPFMDCESYEIASKLSCLSEFAYHEENVWKSIKSTIVPEYQTRRRDIDNGIRLVINEEVMTHRKLNHDDFINLLNIRKNGTRSILDIVNVNVFFSRIDCFIKNLYDEI